MRTSAITVITIMFCFILTICQIQQLTRQPVDLDHIPMANPNSPNYVRPVHIEANEPQEIHNQQNNVGTRQQTIHQDTTSYQNGAYINTPSSVGQTYTGNDGSNQGNGVQNHGVNYVDSSIHTELHPQTIHTTSSNGVNGVSYQETSHSQVVGSVGYETSHPETSYTNGVNGANYQETSHPETSQSNGVNGVNYQETSHPETSYSQGSSSNSNNAYNHNSNDGDNQNGQVNSQSSSYQTVASTYNSNNQNRENHQQTPHIERRSSKNDD